MHHKRIWFWMLRRRRFFFLVGRRGVRIPLIAPTICTVTVMMYVLMTIYLSVKYEFISLEFFQQITTIPTVNNLQDSFIHQVLSVGFHIILTYHRHSVRQSCLYTTGRGPGRGRMWFCTTYIYMSQRAKCRLMTDSYSAK